MKSRADKTRCPVPGCKRAECVEWEIWSSLAARVKIKKTQWRRIKYDRDNLSLDIVSHRHIKLIHAKRQRRPWKLFFPHGELRCDSCKVGANERFCLHMQAVFVLLDLLKPTVDTVPVAIGTKTRDLAAVRWARHNEERELPKIVMELSRILPERSAGEQKRGRPRLDFRDAAAAFLMKVQRKHGMEYASGACEHLLELGATVAPSAASICRFGRRIENLYYLRYLQLASCLPARELVTSGAIDATGWEDHLRATYREKAESRRRSKNNTESEADKEVGRATSRKFAVQRDYVMDVTWQDYQNNLKPISFLYRHQARDLHGHFKIKIENDPHRARAESSYFPTTHLVLARYFPNVIATRGDKAYAGKANYFVASQLGIRPVIDPKETDGKGNARNRKSAPMASALTTVVLQRDADPEAWAQEYHRRNHKEGCHHGEKVVNGSALRHVTWNSQDAEVYARKILDNLRVMLALRRAGHHIDFRMSKAILDAEPMPDLESLAKEYYRLSKTQRLSQIEDLTNREVIKVRQAREKLKELVRAA